MPSHIYSMLGMWKESVAANQAALRVAAEFAEKYGVDGVLADVPRAYDALAYAHLQLGQDASALAAVNEAAKPAKIVGSLPVAQAARAARRGALCARAPGLEGRGEARDGRGLRGRRSGDALRASARRGPQRRDPGAARADINKLRAVRAAFDGAHQVYWTEQTEMLVLAAQAWVVQAQGSRREAHKLMRAAADLEDASAKNTVLESRIYPMRELLADLLREQGDPGAALTGIRSGR